MAGSAYRAVSKEVVAVPVSPLGLKEHVARLYGQGFPRATVAKMLVDYLCPRHDWPLQKRHSRARKKLTTWERQEDFRDLMYVYAVQKLDLATPAIFNGLANKAKRGRVDAARLALELTGRHNPKGEQQPAQVAVIISGVPRPAIAYTPPDGSVVIEPTEAMIAEDEDV